MSGSSRAATLASIAVALAMVLGACTIRPGSATPGTTGVRGTVTAGPTCPVVTEPPNPSCADRPVGGAVLIFRDGSGAEVGRVTSAADGTFSMALAPGAYQLVPQPVQGLMGTAAAMTVTVEADQPMTEVTVSYDTGIR